MTQKEFNYYLITIALANKQGLFYVNKNDTQRDYYQL